MAKEYTASGVQVAGAISLFPRVYPAAATAITRGVQVGRASGSSDVYRFCIVLNLHCVEVVLYAILLLSSKCCKGIQTNDVSFSDNTVWF